MQVYNDGAIRMYIRHNAVFSYTVLFMRVCVQFYDQVYMRAMWRFSTRCGARHNQITAHDNNNDDNDDDRGGDAVQVSIAMVLPDEYWATSGSVSRKHRRTSSTRLNENSQHIIRLNFRYIRSLSQKKGI